MHCRLGAILEALECSLGREGELFAEPTKPNYPEVVVLHAHSYIQVHARGKRILISSVAVCLLASGQSPAIVTDGLLNRLSAPRRPRLIKTLIASLR